MGCSNTSIHSNYNLAKSQTPQTRKKLFNVGDSLIHNEDNSLNNSNILNNENKNNNKKNNLEIEYGKEDELNDNKTINYSKPIRINNQTWLTYDFKINPSIYGPFIDNIPYGYKIPKLIDYFILFKNLGKENIDILLNELQMNKEYFYVTKTKYAKNLNDGRFPDAWRFKSLGFDKIINVDKTWVDKKIKKIEELNLKYIKILSNEMDVSKLKIHELDAFIKVLYNEDLNNGLIENSDERIENEEDREEKSIIDIIDKKEEKNDEKKIENLNNNELNNNEHENYSEKQSEISKIEEKETASKYKVYRKKLEEEKLNRQQLLMKLLKERELSELDDEESFTKEDLKEEFMNNVWNYKVKAERLGIEKTHKLGIIGYNDKEEDENEEIHLNEKNNNMQEENKELIKKDENEIRSDNQIEKIEKEDNLFSKLNLNIFDINTYQEREVIRCKLIADETLIGKEILCSKTIEEINRDITFESPLLYNIEKIKWEIKYYNRDLSLYENVSDDLILDNNRILTYNFSKTGEYIVILNIVLFYNRKFKFKREIFIHDKIKISPKNEIINGIDYGKSIKIGNQIWLQNDLYSYINYKNQKISLEKGKGPGLNGENSYIDSVSACPIGWRLPSKSDIEELLRFCGSNTQSRVEFLLNPNGFKGKINENKQYGNTYDIICFEFVDLNIGYNKNNDDNNNYDKEDHSILKSNQIIKSVSNSDIFNKHAYCLTVSNNSAYINTKSTSLSGIDSLFNTRCIAIMNNFDISIGIDDDTNLEVNKEVTFKVDIGYIEKIIWILKENRIIKKKDETLEEEDKEIKWEDAYEVKHIFVKGGYYKIKLEIHLFERKNYIEKDIFVKDSNIISGLKDSFFIGHKQIFSISLSNVLNNRNINENIDRVGSKKDDFIDNICLVEKNDYVHFQSQTVLFCNCLSEFSYFIICFYDLNNIKLKIFKCSIEHLKLDRQPLFTLDYAIPISITNTSKGYSILCKDSRDDNLLFILGISPFGEILWRNIIMQNGNLPIFPQKDQLMFYDPMNEKPVFGMETMHRPISGSLAYGNNKICCLFSYYNYFGSNIKGEREDNQGDSIVIYSDNGMEVNLVNSWSTTHSLCHRLFFSNGYFYSASLGDGHPQNIKILRIDGIIKNNIKNIEYKYLGNINNNGKGLYIKDISYTSNLFNKDFLNKRDYKSSFDLNKQFKLESEELKQNKSSSASNLNEIYSLYDSLIYKLNLFSSDNLNNRNQSKALDLIISSLSTNKLKVYMNLRHDYIYCKALEGSIPGDLRGKTSGRLGGFFRYDNEKIILIYSRIPCIDSGEINKQNEFGMIVYNNNLLAIKKIIFNRGDCVVCIKSGLYGKNIFISYMIDNQRPLDSKYECDYVRDDMMVYSFLCDIDGNIIISNENNKKININGIFNLEMNIFNVSDDLFTLNNGSLLWGFTDRSNLLSICFMDINYSTDYLIAKKQELINFCIPVIKLFNNLKEEKAKTKNKKMNNIDLLDYDEHDNVRMKLKKQAEEVLNEIKIRKNFERIVNKEVNIDFTNENANKAIFDLKDEKLKLELMKKEKERLLRGRKVKNEKLEYDIINDDEEFNLYDQKHGIYAYQSYNIDENSLLKKYKNIKDEVDKEKSIEKHYFM